MANRTSPTNLWKKKINRIRNELMENGNYNEIVSAASCSLLLIPKGKTFLQEIIFAVNLGPFLYYELFWGLLARNLPIRKIKFRCINWLTQIIVDKFLFSQEKSAWKWIQSLLQKSFIFTYHRHLVVIFTTIDMM